MKKSLTLVLTMCVASAMVLSACGESKTQETTAETTTAETTVAAEESSEETTEAESEESSEAADETEEQSEEAEETTEAAETKESEEAAVETEEASETEKVLENVAEETSEEAAAETEEAAAPAEEASAAAPVFKMSEKAAEEAPAGEATDAAAPAEQSETPPAKPEGNPPEGAPAEPGAAPAEEAPAEEESVEFSSIIQDILNGTSSLIDRSNLQAAAPAAEAPADDSSSEAIGKQTEELEITVDGVTGLAQYEDVEDGTSEVRHFKVTFDGKEYYGTIDKGVWSADDAEGDAVIAAYQEAHESDPSFMGAPGGGSGDGESPAGESAEAPAQAEAEAAEVTVTFSTGETAKAVVGEPFEFFFQCDAPGDMGAPADGEEGAGIIVSSGTVAYSNVGLGGPNSYPTSEKVTITGFEGDFEVTVCDEASAMDATHTIYFDEADIEEAIANAEAMAAQMAANPMDGGSGEEGAAGESAEAPAGEASDGAAPEAQGEEPPAKPEGNPPEGAPAEPGAEAPAEEKDIVVPVFKMSEKAAEEAPAAEAPAGDSSSEAIGKQTEELEITVDGVTGLAQYEDVEDGTSEVRHFKVTFDGKEYYGTIDKGVWSADDVEGDAVIAAYQEAHESDPSFMGAPEGGSDEDASAGESAETPAEEAADGAAPAAQGEEPPAKPEGNPPEGAPAEPDAAAPAEQAPAEEAPAQAEAEAAEVTVTFSTGETAKAVVGEPFEFFFQCDAPGDMGAPKDGEEGAGITVSSGTVEYSNVGLGGPNSYPTSEKVTITGFEGDFEVTVCDEASAMDATHTIYFDETDIEEAIANAEAMAAQMAENPMDGGSGEEGASGESAEAPAEDTSDGAAPEAQGEEPPAKPEGNPPEGAPAEPDAAAPAEEAPAEEAPADDSSSEAIGKQTEELEITVDGVTGLAQYEDVEDGTSEVRHFKVTFDGKEYYGTIDKGVWSADDAEGDAVIAAYQEAHESDPSFMGAPGGGSGDGESPDGESPDDEYVDDEYMDGEYMDDEYMDGEYMDDEAAEEIVEFNSIIKEILNGTSPLIDRSKYQKTSDDAAETETTAAGESTGDMSDAPPIPDGLQPGEEPPGGFGGID